MELVKKEKPDEGNVLQFDEDSVDEDYTWNEVEPDEYFKSLERFSLAMRTPEPINIILCFALACFWEGEAGLVKTWA